MKKIIVSLSIIGVVASVAVGLTSAYFSDSEASQGNTVAIGTMDLNIDGANDIVTTMTVQNKAPGDSGQDSSVLSNVGTLSGLLDIKMDNIADYPCTNDTHGVNDGTENCTSDAGALSSNLDMAFYIDADQDNAWSTGDIGLKSDESIYSNTGSTSLEYSRLSDYDNDVWVDVYTGAMNSTVSDNFVIDWEIPSSTGNEIQGDAVIFDLEFILRQVCSPATS